MENQGFLWYLGFCLILCAVPSRSQYFFEDEINDINKIADIKSDDKWSDKNASKSRPEEIIWKRDSSSSRRGIDANKVGCSRYCIQKTGNPTIDTIKRVNIIWKITDDSRVIFSGETSSWGIADSSTKENDILWQSTKISFNKTDIFSYNDPTCELYLELGCEAHSKSNISTYTLPSDEILNRDEKKLLTVDLMEGYTERKFNVDKTIEKLKILALGKLSQAILEIPIASRAGDSTDPKTPSLILSLSRTSDEKGVRFDARNPPTGEWRLKLLGVENSNYSFSVVPTSTKTIIEDSNVHVFTSVKSQIEDVANPNEKSSTPQRLIYLKTSDDNIEEQPIKTDDQQIFVDELLLKEQPEDEPEMLKLATSKVSFVTTEATELSERKFIPKFVKGAKLEVEIMKSQVNDKIISRSSSVESSVETANIVEDSELEELSIDTDEIQRRIGKTVIDLSPDAQLIASPGQLHDVLFTVTNNQALTMRYVFRGRSTVFPGISVLPYMGFIRSGETIQVAVRIQVPNTQDPSPSIVTLYAIHNEDLEIAKKSTYVYVQGSSMVTNTDNDKPSIDYSFNDNCNGKLNRDRCNKSLWNVEVTVKDSDSGLKMVTSQPKGVEPHLEFIAGTKSSVTFYYVSTCCHTTVDIKATDIQGKVNTRTIDVREWDNLSQGEIAAIVVGALLVLFLIILIILLVIYCIRKTKSHDLSYSQRYGSRTAASAERTNF